MSKTADVDNYPVYYDVDMITSGSKYDYQTRYNAVVNYIAYGNMRRVAEITGIPQDTIYGWSRKEWWDKLVTKLKDEKSSEFDAGFGRLIEKSIKVIENQLDTDQVKAMDAAKIAGIAFDKRQILNNRPTHISGKSQDISKLQAEFDRYLSAKEINPTGGESTD